MPEGPEIRYSREKLKRIVGLHLTNIKALSRKRVYIPKKSKIINIDSKGKLLWIETKDYFVHIHHGISGWININKEGDYTKYIINLSNDTTIYVDSMRKFTKVRVYKKVSHKRLIEKLGVDIFTKEFTHDFFKKEVESRNTIIAKFLLEQNRFSGIGNYIKNDALYLSKINPKRLTGTLKGNEIKKLYESIRYVAFSNLIDWLKSEKIKIPKDIQKIKPGRLKSNYKFKVYGREKDQKGNRVTKEKVSGRWTYWVKSVQK